MSRNRCLPGAGLRMLKLTLTLADSGPRRKLGGLDFRWLAASLPNLRSLTIREH